MAGWGGTYSIDCSCRGGVHDDDAGASVKGSPGHVGGDVVGTNTNAAQSRLPVGVWGGIQPAQACTW